MFHYLKFFQFKRFQLACNSGPTSVLDPLSPAKSFVLLVDRHIAGASCARVSRSLPTSDRGCIGEQTKYGPGSMPALAPEFDDVGPTPGRSSKVGWDASTYFVAEIENWENVSTYYIKDLSYDYYGKH